jgi:hypothetical protein
MLAYIPYMDPMGMGLDGIIIFYMADYHHDSMTIWIIIWDIMGLMIHGILSQQKGIPVDEAVWEATAHFV